MSMDARPGERGVPELLADLADETARLVKHEAALATRELGEKVRVAANQVVIVAIALLVASASLLTLIASLVIGLSAYVPAWESALVVGVLLALVAGVLYAKTVTTLSNVSPVPERTAKSLEETKTWIRQQTR